METVTNSDLIRRAASVTNPRDAGECEIGTVGCALLTAEGNVYVGVSIHTGSGIGFCAEHGAIAAMVTAGESRIRKIVATWRGEDGLYVIPPCGRCRELIKKVHQDNLGAEVILGRDEVARVGELLPHHDEFRKI